MFEGLRLSRGARRVAQVLTLAALALTWWGDWSVVTAPGTTSVTSWVPVVATGPLATLALPDTRWSPSLVTRCHLAAAMSLVLSCFCLLYPQSRTTWGVLEGVCLQLLVLRVLARPLPRRSTARALCALVLASALLPTRHHTLHRLVLGSYSILASLGLLVVVGCWIRTLENSRLRAVRETREAERLALARDLHDLIAHHMTGIIVQANAARSVQASSPETTGPVFESIARAGTEALESMRRLVRVLREEGHSAAMPPAAGDLLTRLGDLLSDFHQAQTDTVTARLEATAASRTARFSPEIENSVYRVVQESLTNVRRHAPGARVTVELDTDGAWVHVSVVNSTSRGRGGGGGPVGGRGGLGLVGLHERVTALEGTFRAGNAEGGQWQVAASLPL